ncbi:MAG: epoxyqueuosine reductase QueH [Syntrophales bacterium]|jgi:predicted adenine nucleotide alpha hydrolase (AANH) superfamily ATPase|nr:epoxyqueuosine reductase QueH [Syntrophales bacterium]
MKILLHICCGPCAIHPLGYLRSAGHDVEGFFYNPNIHPYAEYRKRLETLQIFAREESLPLEVDPGYPVERYFQRVSFDEGDRCRHCYEERLHAAFSKAVERKADALTTTLLYSRYQKHDLIAETAEELSARYGVTFFYHDFREGWREGIRISKERGMYRQNYCGCIFSERERFCKA